jgi:hypothetical protein
MSRSRPDETRRISRLIPLTDEPAIGDDAGVDERQVVDDEDADTDPDPRSGGILQPRPFHGAGSAGFHITAASGQMT